MPPENGPLALGVDIGMSGVRAAVVDGHGRVVGSGRRVHLGRRIGTGVAEHDPEEWIRGLLGAARDALAGIVAPRVEVIGVAGLGPAPVLVDRQLQPLTPALLFSLDTRAESERKAVAATLAPVERARTFDSAVPKLLWWQRNEPAVWDRAAWALDATGFVVSTLTGTPTMDTITALEYELPGWACPIALPAPVPPSAVAGALSADFSELLGLTAGLPVIAGTYDSYVDVAAAGAAEPGDGCCVLGSTTIVCQVATEPINVDGLASSAYTGRGYLAGGWTLSGGSALDWGKTALGTEADIAEVAGTLDPGAGGLLCLPYLAGERTPIWDLAARGAVIGISLDTDRAQLYRALIDAVALSVRDHTTRMAEALAPPTAWLATGGGTMNRTLVQAVGDAIGAPLQVVADAGLAVGPAYLALRATGHRPARAVERVVLPVPDHTHRYGELLEFYRDLYVTLRGVTRGLSGDHPAPRESVVH